MATVDDSDQVREDSGTPEQNTLGSFIRMQRQLARMSLREMAAMTAVSNAYLSQIERNLHQPSLKVMQSIAHALRIPTSELLRQAGITTPESDDSTTSGSADRRLDTEWAIRTDPRLSQTHRDALLEMYRNFLAEG